MSAANQQVSKSASRPHSHAELTAPRTRHFRDLVVWQKAMSLARNLYAATDCMPAREQFGMTSQMRRSAVSIPSNIAEGHGRTTDRGFVVFLAHARGSLYELQTQIQLADDLGFLRGDSAKTLMTQSEEVGRLINGLLKTVKG
jgi:four helix bundle protein